MIKEEKVFEIIRNLLGFPYPQICRHLVALDLLSLLIEHGVNVDENLIKAVVSCDDIEALELLSKHKGT